MASDYHQRKKTGNGVKTYSNKKPLPSIKTNRYHDDNKKVFADVKYDKKLKNEKIAKQLQDGDYEEIKGNDTQSSTLAEDTSKKERPEKRSSTFGDKDTLLPNVGRKNRETEIDQNQSFSIDDHVFEKSEPVYQEKQRDNSQDDNGGELQSNDFVDVTDTTKSSLSEAVEKDNEPATTEPERVQKFSNLHTKDSARTMTRKKNGFTSTYHEYPIFKYVQDNVIGHDVTIDGPYGRKTGVGIAYQSDLENYAAGRVIQVRSLKFIEDYIRDNVCPMYANTHSETGHNARQTSKFREEARQIIKKCVNAGKDDVVVFTGSGVTSCVHKIIWGLRLREKGVPEDTVIFIGPYEHHSNILPWREMKTKLVRIKEDKDGRVDLEHLQESLKFWKDKRRHLLVIMSAASNVTGIITDTETVSCIAHKYGAWVVFDYAAGGPYLEVDMNSSKHSYIDAALFSPHKFVGGPGTPGVIIAKKWMFRNSVPDRVGGGTVRYVTRSCHEYTFNIEEREEGGTPAIIESIRAGLVFQLKHSIGEEAIEEREEFLCRKAFEVWDKNPDLIVLGNHSARRVAIFSFLVRHRETGKLIHQNFVSTLLSELYGIQARGGCACAGPYAADLLGISETTAKSLFPYLQDRPKKDQQHATLKQDVLKPGFSRINLPFFYSDELCDFIIQAVSDVATHGWRIMPEYTFDAVGGTWRHKGYTENDGSDMMSLHDLHIGKDTVVNTRSKFLQTAPISTQDTLKKALDIMQKSSQSQYRPSTASIDLQNTIPRKMRHLMWFMTPQDIIDLQRGSPNHISKRKHRELFTPRVPSPRVTLNSSQTPDEII